VDGKNGDDLIGTIKPFYLPSAPIGWLELNGSAFDTSKYSSLYSLLGTNKLPDFRECVLVGAGQSDNDYDASTNPNGIHEHDVYNVGEFKDDQFQGHKHSLPQVWGTEGPSAKCWDTEYSTGKATRTGNPISDDVNGEPRVGSTTHGKQVGVLYCIKAL